jgi:cell division protein FtsQ
VPAPASTAPISCYLRAAAVDVRPAGVPRARLRRPRVRRPHAIALSIVGALAGSVRRDTPIATAGSRQQKAVAGLLASAALICALVLTTDAGRRLRAAIPGLPSTDAALRAAGLGIDQVSLTGHRMTFDGDVFDALDLANVRSMVGLDAPAAKRRIERLPWVATAELTRVLPNRLEVRISERKPFAVWRRGDRRFLIDETGRVLSSVAADTRADLPRVSGEGAASEARAVLGLVARYPEIARRLEEAERVAERRWTLRLSGSVVLNLPPDREASALDLIGARPDLARIVAGENCVVDLRAPERVAVRRAASAASGTAPSIGCG